MTIVYAVCRCGGQTGQGKHQVQGEAAGEGPAGSLRGSGQGRPAGGQHVRHCRGALRSLPGADPRRGREGPDPQDEHLVSIREYRAGRFPAWAGMVLGVVVVFVAGIVLAVSVCLCCGFVY